MDHRTKTNNTTRTEAAERRRRRRMIRRAAGTPQKRDTFATAARIATGAI